MVLISEVIMVVTTLVTLCQSAPARRGTKVKHEHRHDAHSDGRLVLQNISEPYNPDDVTAGGDRSGTAGSIGNWTRAESPGTSNQHDESNSEFVPHPTRHRQHDSNRRRHKHHHEQQNHNNRGRYEHLCESIMKTVHLNTDTEEYNPPFYVEVRCRQPQQTHSYSTVQKCGFNLLHCVQTYSTLNFSRRKADGTDCWQPFTLDVPSGCECMWPMEEFGPLNRRDDL